MGLTASTGSLNWRIWGREMGLRVFFGVFVLISAAVIGVTSVRPAVAREVVVPLFSGVVFADGRPIEKAIAIRMEAENSAMIDTTYTLDSGKFLFRNLLLVYEDVYFLVIREPEYRELRYRVERSQFVADSASAAIVHSIGSVILDLERLPPERKIRKAEPKAVDARQLKAEISDEARREFNLGLKNIADGSSKEALAHLKKAVELSPEYFDALARLGSEYMKAGQPREAETMLERAQALNPNDPIPMTNLGTLQFQEGERVNSAGAGNSPAAETAYRNAADLFEKALRLNPLAPRTNFYLGIALYKLGAYERSESVLINTLALDGRMHEARLTLINIYNRQHRYDDALKQISEYLKANPDAPQRKQLEEMRTEIQGALARR
jgi:Flp pilus assembly protein TadD